MNLPHAPIAILHTPHAYFSRDALCPTLASARRSISSIVGHRANAHLQQRKDHDDGRNSP